MKISQPKWNICWSQGMMKSKVNPKFCENMTSSVIAGVVVVTTKKLLNLIEERGEPEQDEELKKPITWNISNIFHLKSEEYIS